MTNLANSPTSMNLLEYVTIFLATKKNHLNLFFLLFFFWKRNYLTVKRKKKKEKELFIYFFKK